MTRLSSSYQSNGFELRLVGRNLGSTANDQSKLPCVPDLDKPNSVPADSLSESREAVMSSNDLLKTVADFSKTVSLWGRHGNPDQDRLILR